MCITRSYTLCINLYHINMCFVKGTNFCVISFYACRVRIKRKNRKKKIFFLCDVLVVSERTTLCAAIRFASRVVNCKTMKNK